MTFDEYQKAAMRTAGSAGTDKTKGLNVTGLGCSGEAGEVAGVVKKHLFHHHPLDEAKLREELGDVLWYIALGAHSLGTTLENIAKENVEKLKARYPNGFETERSMNRESA